MVTAAGPGSLAHSWFLSRAPLPFPKDKKGAQGEQGFEGKEISFCDCSVLKQGDKTCKHRMAATKDHGGESRWPRRGFQRKGWARQKSKPRFPCEPTFGCGLFYRYCWQISFTFSPLPFPFDPIVQAVLGLVLLNLVVTLGPRNKLLSP